MNHKVIGIEINPEGAQERSVKPTEPGKRKNGQTIPVKVTAEADGVLVIETLEGADETYRLCPNRTMYLHVSQLHLSSEVNPFHFGDDDRDMAQEKSLSVRGTATLEDSSISVMGDPGNKARTLAIDFYALNYDVWRKHKELAQILGKAPHYTRAKVGLARQRPDVGADDAWSVQCQVPPAMLRALANAVSRGAIRSISLRLVLGGIYSRGARVLQSVSSGWFLRPNWPDITQEMPETADGNITVLNFEEPQWDSPAEAAPQLHAPRKPIPGPLTQ